MAQKFEDRILSIHGQTNNAVVGGSDLDLTDYLTDAVLDVTNRWILAYPEEADLFMRASTASNTQGLDLNGATILSVVREEGVTGKYRPCSKIPVFKQYSVTETSSLDYASKTNPVYMVDADGKISVFPTPEGSDVNKYIVYYINNVPTEDVGGDGNPSTDLLDHESQGIAYFPRKLEHLVSLKATISLITNHMLNETSWMNLPYGDVTPPTSSTTRPAFPVLKEVSYTDVTSNFDSSAPLFEVASISAASIYTGTAPAYSKTNLSLTPPPAITALSISESPPSKPEAPSIISSGVATISKADINTNAPSYNSPVLDPFTDFQNFTSGLSETDPGIFAVSAVPPTIPDISAQTIADFSSVAPNYIKASIAQTSFASFTTGLSETDPGVFSLTAVPPTKESISAQSVSLTGTEPEYIKPSRKAQVAFSGYTSGLSETDPGTFSVASTEPSVPTLSSTSVTISGTAPTFNPPVVASDFSQVSTYIDTDEDIELASVKIQQIAQQLSEYQLNIQAAQATFNEENAEYQAKLQKDIRDAEFDNQEDARLLQKYQAEVSAYQANTNKEIQQYTQKMSLYQLELNTSYTAWAKTESDNLQEYQLDIQSGLNDFNKENAKYQAKVQVDIQDAQLKDANEARKLQDYQAAISVYQADVNREVQEYTQKLNQYQLELNTRVQAWSKTETDNIAVFNANIQNEINEFNRQNSIYQATIQEKIQEAQLADAHEARKLQKYQNEMSSYQANINKEVQEYQQKLSQYQAELNIKLQAWQKSESDKLAKYQTDVQTEVNKFNEGNTKYQASVQAEITKAQIDAQEAQKEGDMELQATLEQYRSTLQKYQNDLSRYQAIVAKEVQQHQQNLSADIQKWQITRQTEIQEHGNLTQDELNEFNKENVAYQAAIQESNQNAQLENQKNIAKAQADLQRATADKDRDLQRELQNAVNNMQAIVADNEAIMTRYNAEIAAYNADISEYNAEINKWVQDKSLDIQARDEDMKRWKGMQDTLIMQYERAFTTNQPQQAKQQGE